MVYFANKLLLLILLLVLIQTAIAVRVKRVVGGIQAAAPPPNDPVVFARVQNQNSRVEGFRNTMSGMYSFYGIPYAYPPMGNDRFRRPRYKRLVGEVDATKYGQPCPQPDSGGYIVGSEDCLWLNVFSPELPSDAAALPVLVWIHGGGYRYGSANQYSADSITSKAALFVPIQYRLGVLGMYGDGTDESNGNLALFDMMAAIRWVSEHIEYFGGDPKQITVMGHGSGAAAAVYLTSSDKMSREAVSGVVAMSGTPYSQNSIDNSPRQSFEEVSTANKCSSSNNTEIIKCLRDKNFKDMIQMDTNISASRLQGEQLVRGMDGYAGFQPSVDGPANQRSVPGMLENDPRTALKTGSFKKVPLLTGVTRDETANIINVNTIKTIFGSLNKFLENLTSVVKKGLLVGDALNTILPGVDKTLTLKDYLKIPNELNITEAINKLTESTTDALFNLPAILTADMWSSYAPAFLYRFEHKSKQSSHGSAFLTGLPIVSNKEGSNSAVGHGDELAFLFEARDIHGKPLKNNQVLDKADQKIRDDFSSLIVKFAKLNGGKPTKNDDDLQPFNADDANYIRIGGDKKTGTNFRSCQLALWNTSLKPPKTSCKFLLDNLVGTLGNAVNTNGALGLLKLDNNKNKEKATKAKGGLGSILSL